MRRYLGITLLLLMIIVTAGCGSKENAANGKNNKDVLTIKTTLYPLKYFTKRIAGEYANVSSIIPAGSSAHTYEPTTREMVDMAEADAFIYNGAGLESYAESISDAIKPEGVTILEASQGVKLLKGKEEDHHDAEEDHHHGDANPHVWLDPNRAIKMADNIKNMLVELKPEAKEEFNHNYSVLKQQLLDLDKDFQQLESQPKNEIIVSHAAYDYWEQEYGIHQISVSGLSPTNEPSQKEVEAIVEKAKQDDLHYVLFEQNVTPKVSKVVKDEIGAKSLRLHNLSVLTEENIQNHEDYFTLMEHNIDVLKQALAE